MPVSNNVTIDFEPDPGSSIWMEAETGFGERKSTMANTSTTEVFFYSSTFPRMSTAAIQFIGKILSFKSLEPNWDTYGAVPPSDENIDQAVFFVRRADKNLLPFYFVAPGPNGEVVVEFRRGNKEASVYFNADGSNELILNEGNNFVLEGTLEENYKDLLTFINE